MRQTLLAAAAANTQWFPFTGTDGDGAGGDGGDGDGAKIVYGDNH